MAWLGLGFSGPGLAWLRASGQACTSLFVTSASYLICSSFPDPHSTHSILTLFLFRVGTHSGLLQDYLPISHPRAHHVNLQINSIMPVVPEANPVKPQPDRSPFMRSTGSFEPMSRLRSSTYYNCLLHNSNITLPIRECKLDSCLPVCISPP